MNGGIKSGIYVKSLKRRKVGQGAAFDEEKKCVSYISSGITDKEDWIKNAFRDV